jgi:hypothetical protein
VGIKMKRITLLIFLLQTTLYSQNISPQFSELKGMEDQSANTHLFYRIYEKTTWGEYYFSQSNHIYRFDIISGSDSFFLAHYAYENETGVGFRRVNDYDFWNSNVHEYIYCGTAGNFYPYTFIIRFDTSNTYFNWQGVVNKISISNLDDSLIFSGSWATDIIGQNPIRTSKSFDGGYTWQTFSDSLEFLAVMPNDDQTFFCFNDNGYIADYDGRLYKTSNGGASFYLVDTLKKIPGSIIDEIKFDKDYNHIYRAFKTLYNDYVLSVSSNQGIPFTWEVKFSSKSKSFISLDDSISGTIYLANKKYIYLSTDYGDNFNLYKTLERKIVGIYKKPNSNKLYAATKYKIYEITPDTIQVIKSLPIPEEVLNYYPLVVGNKWVYDKHTQSGWNTYHDIFIRTVVGDSLLPNGKKYFHLFEDIVGFYSQTYFERIDSSEGKVYRYDDNQGFPDDEFVIDDLLAEIGDTILSYRMGYWEEGFTTMIDEVTFEKWGLTKHKKVFEQYILHPPVYSLTQDIGLDSIFSYFDFGETRVILKGCIIDGVVYGDTTVVSVEDETPTQPTEFSLSQNYPNPFNPTTTIRFTISDLRFTILKVYDVLGNEVATLVNEELPAGEYEVEFNPASSIRYPASGIYFYQLRAGDYSATKKMILLK